MGNSGPLYGIGHLVGTVLILMENVDFQLLLSGIDPEKRDGGFAGPVAIQILKLYRGGIVAGPGCGILRTQLRQHCVDGIIQIYIVLGHLGQAEQVLRRFGKAAGQ